MVSDEIVSAVEGVYNELEEHLEKITSQTKMKCQQFCNICCNKIDIEASPIEFIPLAAYLYQTGQVDEFLNCLDESDKIGYCVLFSPEAWREGKWACLQYEKRGLICRLFGYGYRLNREGIPELVTCKVLKEICPDEIAKARQLGIEKPDLVPLFSNYFMQLYSIDPNLGTTLMPINQAIRKAIEKLYFYYAPGMEQSE
ncbi:MAG: hypothetical protein WCP85_27270 [Mariniphaga sp.]